LAALPTGVTVRADDSGPSEYQVKAAFLYNFAKFVKWPNTAFSDTNSPIVIGILGEDPFGSDLPLAIRGKTINGHPLSLRVGMSLSDMMQCHVVFICRKPKRNIPDTVASLTKAKILTVSEIDGFIKDGGMINFVMDGTKVRFEINDQTATKAGLLISSKLLNLAKKKESAE
jgi:hypothetical protein